MDNVSILIKKKKIPVYSPAFEDLAWQAQTLQSIPLLGQVQAGQPIDLCEVQDRIAVPANMVRKNTYALRVRGHSMIDDNIQDGDIIVIEKRETAHNGQTVVAMINGEHVTLKRFYVEADGIRLQPANPSMPPICLRNQDVQILGIVTGVVRTLA